MTDLGLKLIIGDIIHKYHKMKFVNYYRLR